MKCSISWCNEDAAWVRKPDAVDDKGETFPAGTRHCVCAGHKPAWRDDWYMSLDAAHEHEQSKPGPPKKQKKEKADADPPF